MSLFAKALRCLYQDKDAVYLWPEGFAACAAVCAESRASLGPRLRVRRGVGVQVARVARDPAPGADRRRDCDPRRRDAPGVRLVAPLLDDGRVRAARGTLQRQVDVVPLHLEVVGDPQESYNRVRRHRNPRVKNCF